MRFKHHRAALIFGICSFATLIYASHLYIFHQWQGNPIGPLEAIGEAAADWYAWAILAPLILWLAERFPVRKGMIGGSLAFHLFGSLVCSLLQVLLHTLFDQILMHHFLSLEAIDRAATAFFARTYHFGLLIYWLIVIVQNAARYYNDKSLHAARLESRLAHAQLSALKMQMQPHFLFNTLHAISSLMHDDTKSAEKMIARLSDLLRVSLKNEDSHEVPLSEELEILNLYLDIEKIRFGERLKVDMEIQPEALSCYVPNLILQPIVENSIRHGISKRRGIGSIIIHAERRDGTVFLDVEDNGGGIAGDPHEGVGLSNIRGRLAQLYGREQSMALHNTTDGLAVHLTLPYHEETTRYED